MLASSGGCPLRKGEQLLSLGTARSKPPGTLILTLQLRGAGQTRSTSRSGLALYFCACRRAARLGDFVDLDEGHSGGAADAGSLCGIGTGRKSDQ